MRELSKHPHPMVLQLNEAAWTAAYVMLKGTNNERNAEKWRHPEIREALRLETNDRCAYCEAKPADISYCHVEHIKPKSKHPDLAHSWFNLTWACPVCNAKKGSTEVILNPYVDEVVNHIFFNGPMVDWHLNSKKGEATVLVLELNRLELLRSRMIVLDHVKQFLARLHTAQEWERPIIERGIELLVKEGEFPSAAISYLASHGYDSSDLEKYLRR